MSIDFLFVRSFDTDLLLLCFALLYFRFVIVWELVSGPDLLDLLNACNGRMTEKQAAHYFRQIHQGVTFLHENGLCHRDLKPENCMVDSKTDTLKIIDFGLSKHLESAVTLGVGTPDYMVRAQSRQ